MIKLLYLLVGISLKQTVDELKSVVQEHIASLKEQRENVKTYKPNPALIAGTQEAHRAMMKAQHSSDVAPQVRGLTRRIFFWRLVPLGLYVSATGALIYCIILMENAGWDEG